MFVPSKGVAAFALGIFFGGIGAVGGAVGGAISGPGWEEIPLDRIRVGVLPRCHDSLALSASLTF